MTTPIIQDVIKGSFRKYKNLLMEFVINVVSFSLLIVTQQVIALPIIARFFDADQFGKIVIAFGISNIITTMFGFSIGSARLLDDKVYNFAYLRMLKRSSVIVILLSFIIYNYLFASEYIDSFIYSIICVVGSIRYFFLSEYRVKDAHDWVFKQNLFYFFGVAIGFIPFYFWKSWLIIFLIAEIVSVSFSYYYLNKNKFFELFKDHSSLKLTNTFHLIVNNGASYSLMYYDRFIIYPILGAANVSLYYSAAISAKIGGFIFNPLSNFILGKLAGKRNEINNKAIIVVVLGAILTTILYFAVGIVATPLLVAILYPDFLSKIEDIFVPICLGAAFMGGVDVLKPVMMKYMGAKYFNKLFLVYGAILILLSIFLCTIYGLLGVAIANTISSFILFISLIFCLYYHCHSEEVNE